jgi:hypothetical protein
MGDVHQPEKLGGARAGAAEGGVIRGPGSHLRRAPPANQPHRPVARARGRYAVKRGDWPGIPARHHFSGREICRRFRVAPDLPRFGPYFAYFQES